MIGEWEEVRADLMGSIIVGLTTIGFLFMKTCQNDSSNGIDRLPQAFLPSSKIPPTESLCVQKITNLNLNL
jgi:hypothetical protein